VGGALAARAVGKIVANRAAQKLATELGGKRQGPRMTGSAYNRVTGKLYKDVSGSPHPKLDPVLEAQAPNPSRTGFPPCNCAEAKAVDQAVKDGSKLGDLSVSSAERRGAELRAPCENCQETLKGVRFGTKPKPGN
jgi:hypothetical protein